MNVHTYSRPAQLAFLLGQIALLGVAACTDQVTQPRPRIVGATPSYAKVINDDFEESGSLSSPCTPEVIVYEGRGHLIVHETSDGHGGFHLGFDRELRSEGTGTVTGTKYVLLNNVHWAVNASPGYEETFNWHDRFVSQGSAPDFLVYVVDHVTVDPNGDVKVIHEKFRADCQ